MGGQLGLHAKVGGTHGNLGGQVTLAFSWPTGFSIDLYGNIYI